MPFDVQGARAAGYTDSEIAGFLGQQSGFDTAGALKSGYQPAEVVDFLTKRTTPQVESDSTPQGDPMGSGFAEIANPSADTSVGGGAGRGSVNPPMAGQPQPKPVQVRRTTSSMPALDVAGNPTGDTIPVDSLYEHTEPDANSVGREVGAGESTVRGFLRAGASLPATAALAGAVPVQAAEFVKNLLHGNAPGADTSWQDAYFGKVVQPGQDRLEAYSPEAGERQSVLAKISEGLGGLVADLPQMLLSGGLTGEAKLAQAAPTLSQFIEDSVSHGFDAMRPIMVRSGEEKAKQVLDAGGTATEATNSAITAALVTGFQGGQPMAAEGKLAARVATGLPVGAVQADAARVVQNAADPESLRRPFDPAELAVGAATNAVAAVAMGHSTPGRAADRIDLGYDPTTGKTAVADAVQGMGSGSTLGRFEPGQAERPAPVVPKIISDHFGTDVGEVLSAPTVEDAIAAAQKAVGGSDSSVRDQMLAIRPMQESAPDASPGDAVRPDVAGASGRGLADADRSLEPGMGGVDESVNRVPAAPAARDGAGEPLAPRAADAVAPDELVVTTNPSGTLTVRGADPQAVFKLLRDNGITSAVRSADGVLVGRSQVEAAQRVVADFQHPDRIDSGPGQLANEPTPTVRIESPVPAQPGKVADTENTASALPPDLTPKERKALEGNPFRLFLMRQGLAVKLASEFAPGTKERLSMGRTFRKGGMGLDDLAERAAEVGFIKDASDTDALYDLIRRSVAGERISPLYGTDGVNDLRTRMERQRDAEQEAHEAEIARIAQDSSHDFGLAPEELHDDGYTQDTAAVQARVRELVARAEAHGLDASAIMEEAHYATENGTPDDFLNAARHAIETSVARGRGEGAGDRREDSGAQGRQAERSEETGLSRPSADDVVAQQERAKAGEREAAQRRADEEARVKADAELPDFGLTGSDREADANPDQAPMFRAGDALPPITREQAQNILSRIGAKRGITREQFTDEVTKAFGAKTAERLMGNGVVVPLADQTRLPAHVVPYVREGNVVYGFHDPLTNKTYAVLSNLTPAMVKGLVLHEVGVHYGFRNMLGGEKYDAVMERLKVMGRAGNKEVNDALARARKNSVNEAQVREETLAYLVQSNANLGLVREVVARIRAFLYSRFDIGGNSLSVDDITALARAAVLHSSRTNPGDRAPDFSRSTQFAQEDQPRPLDHGELSIPNRTKNIDAELDRYKAEQAKVARQDQKQQAAERKTDKAAAREQFDQLWPAMSEKLGPRFGVKALRETLDDMVKWQPKKFLAMAEKFKRENGIEPQAPSFSRDDSLHDIARQGYEVPTVQAGRRLRSMLEKYDDGKLTQPELELKLRILADDMSGAAQVRQLKADSAERVRGSDWVRERLLRARRTGELDGGSVDFALWALDQNPSIADGLGLSIRSPGAGSMTAGHYNPSERIATLMRGSANSDTAVHEIMHHTERMMPADVQKGIAAEWSRQLGKAMATAEGPRKEALGDMVRAMAGDDEAHKNVRAAFKSGVLDYERDYQLSNPSEFWAVNASRILRERAETDGWVGKAKQWLGEFVEKAKGWFGLASDASVLKGLHAVMSGDGEFVSKRMLANVKDFEAIAPEPSFARADEADLPDEVQERTPLPGANLLDRAGSWLTENAMTREAIMFAAPMSATTNKKAQAVAQQFANDMRVASHQWGRMRDLIERNFSEADRERMWNAADEENVERTRLRDEPGYTREEGRGLESLPPNERAVVEQLHHYSEELWNSAVSEGMVEGEGLPFWTPRMLVTIGEDGDVGKLRGAGTPKIPGEPVGRNVSTTSSNLKQRKYLTTEETEAAASAIAQKQGEQGAKVVRDIMVMPLAMSRLERAVAGRKLVNQVKALGLATGEDLIRTDGRDPNYVMIAHPAFTTYKPKFTEVDGKTVVMTDQNGEPVFEGQPLYVRRDFEGPLKAVMSTRDPAIYTGLMLLKSKAMSAIMFSPLIHNMVIWGKAFAYSPAKMVTFSLYAKGSALQQDPEFMRGAIRDGMVPIGANRSNMVDVTELAQPVEGMGKWGDPNESWISLGSQKLGNAIKAGFGDKAKEGLDAAGDFVHHTLLWKQIGNLQAGIYADAKGYYERKGMGPDAAGVIAAHLANRYGGIIGGENMGKTARMLANVMLFSRSFTLTNWGIIKDAFRGIPSGLRATIEERAGATEADKAAWVMRRKAWGVIARDLGYSVILLSAVQSLVDKFKNDKSLSEIEQGYLRRLQGIGTRIGNHPLDPRSYNPYQVSPTWDNEPGKKFRIDMGPDEAGRHQYMRLPMGKVVEEMVDWFAETGKTAWNKMAPLPKSAWEAAVTHKDAFGTPIADPNGSALQRMAETLGHVVKAQMPYDMMKMLYNTTQGYASDLDKKKLAGNLTGFTFSQGHPGGPEAAVAAQANDRFEESRKYVLQLVKDDLKKGDVSAASDRMEAIGMTPREINQAIQRIEAPKSGLSSKARRNFERRANEGEREEMDTQRSR